MIYLLDMSAFARLPTSDTVTAVLEGPVVDGDVATCGVLALEAGWSARSAADHGQVAAALAALPWVDITPEDWRRAVHVQGLLALKGQHRSAGFPDLLLAAAAERTGLTVLHYDSDYDIVAAITGQPTQWVVPRGSV